MAWHVRINSCTQALALNTCTQNRPPGKNRYSADVVCPSQTGQMGRPCSQSHVTDNSIELALVLSVTPWLGNAIIAARVRS